MHQGFCIENPLNLRCVWLSGQPHEEEAGRRKRIDEPNLVAPDVYDLVTHDRDTLHYVITITNQIDPCLRIQQKKKKKKTCD